MINQSDIEALGSLPLFEGLTQSELDTVIKTAVIRRLSQDEFFFFQGDPAESIYVLREGRVKLTQLAPDGQQILLRVLGPWRIFAIVGMVPDRTYPVTAQATEPAEAYVWRGSEMMALVEKIPRLSINAMKLMSEYVQEFQDRLREIATERVERRLARALIRLAAQTGQKKEEGVIINLQLTRQDLAEMVGTTLYTVSRILSQWENNGLILSGRERVVIRNPHGLVKIAEDV